MPLHITEHYFHKCFSVFWFHATLIFDDISITVKVNNISEFRIIGSLPKKSIGKLSNKKCFEQLITWTWLIQWMLILFGKWFSIRFLPFQMQKWSRLHSYYPTLSNWYCHCGQLWAIWCQVYPSLPNSYLLNIQSSSLLITMSIIIRLVD